MGTRVWENVPPLRRERHFDGREALCFAERAAGLDDLLAAAVRASPEADAWVFEGERVDYAGLEERVATVAAGLVELGLEPGDRVGLVLGNRPQFLELMLAAARIGAIAVPVSTRESRDGLGYILGHCGARALFHEAALVEVIPGPDVLPALRHRVAVGDPPATGDYARLLAAQDRIGPSRPAEEACAIILYTSGTTGAPKGAMLTHFNLVHSIAHYRLCLGLETGERSVLAVPASHVTGVVANLLTMVGCAGCNVILPAFEVGAFLALAARERMTHTVMVPAMYKLCLMRADLDEFDLGAWRVGGYGGAPMPEALIAELADKLPGLVLHNIYGATETTSPTTVMPAGHTAAHPDSVGQVVPCGEVRIVDEQGRDVAPGESGELWIKGPMVVPGYWAAPELGARSFPGGYWRSGDVGSLDPEGWVRIHDRLKDVVNRGGYKVPSVEVENAISHLPEVVECAVVAHPDPVLGEKIHAFVFTAGAPLEARRVSAACEQRLASYKWPDYVTITGAALPRNANGKLLKAELRKRAAAGD